MPNAPRSNMPGAQKANLRPVACSTCRERRSYCSKELPKCSRCKDKGLKCIYAKGRKITVSELYLRNLESRVKDYEENGPPASIPSDAALSWVDGVGSGDGGSESLSVTGSLEEGLGGQSVGEGHHDYRVSATGRGNYNYVGPTAYDDFQRRVSRLFPGLNGTRNTPQRNVFFHPALLRVQKLVPNVEFPPEPALARMWYSAQYSYIGTIFAFSNPEAFEAQLAEIYREGPPDAGDIDTALNYSKILVLLAFGRMYSVNQWYGTMLYYMTYFTRITEDRNYGVPGMELFCQAVQYLPAIHEEPSLAFVETLSLVGYFFQNLGQRDTAFLYMGIALRMALSMGLHQELDSPELDAAMKERRRRLWWSVYSLDRILTIKSGNPIMVQDDDIRVALPTKLPEEPLYGPWLVLRHYTELSRILTRIMSEVYRSPQKSGAGLLTSVREILSSLAEWKENIPNQLLFDIRRLDFTRESVSVFLHFYQCINMTVRPLLFAVVEKRITWSTEQRAQDWRLGLSDPTVKVIQTGISAAVDTIAMTMTASQKNLLAAFGYMDGEHCFSATIVLVLACLAFPYEERTFSAMDSAFELLNFIVDRGNSNMTPRLRMLEQVRSSITTPSNIVLPTPFPLNRDQQDNPMVYNFPQVNNETLGELSVDPSGATTFGDSPLWEQGYGAVNWDEYDLTQWMQTGDPTWNA